MYSWSDFGFNWYVVSPLCSDVLDDEVAESVYRDRDLILDLEPLLELTADIFTSTLAQHDHLVVLFYIKCKCRNRFSLTLTCKTFTELNLCCYEMLGELTSSSNESVCPLGEAVSIAFLHSFVEVAEALEGKEEVIRP